MNSERFRELAAVIEQHPDLYRQATWGIGRDPRECGTPACALGWASALWAPVNRDDYDGAEIRQAGGEALGLTAEEYGQLFYGTWPAAWWIGAGLEERLEAEWGRPRERRPNNQDAAQILRWMSGLARFPLVNGRGELVAAADAP